MAVDVLRGMHGSGAGFLESIVESTSAGRGAEARALLRESLEPDTRLPRRRVSALLRSLGVEHVTGLLGLAASAGARPSVADVVTSLREAAALSAREAEVLCAYARGLRPKSIEVAASPRTVEFHLQNVRRRLEITRMDAVLWRVSTIIDGAWSSKCTEPSRAEPSRAEPSRAEPSRAEPSRAYITSQ